MKNLKENSLFELVNVTKQFKLKNKEIKALEQVSLKFESGKFYAIMGHSGSGKSTMINILGLLDSISNGSYKINEVDSKNFNADEKALFRKSMVGFIFQDFYLDENLKAYENVIMPMLINKNITKNLRKKKAMELLKLVDLNERATHFPKELSGGEQQRVAIARALANNPKLILADEPTGDLDEENEKKIFSILKKLSQDGKCIVVVSHSNEVKKYADTIYYLKNGKIVEDKDESK